MIQVISMFVSDAKENVIEKISYEEIEPIQRNLELYIDTRSNEFIGISKLS